MSAHLNERDLDTVVAGLGLSREAEEHLADCLVCRRRVAKTGDLIEARRRSILAGAPVWESQRSAILARLDESAVVPVGRQKRWLRPMLAAAAVLLATGIGLHRMPGGGVEQAEVPVEQILAQVDATLAAEMVPGFEGLDPIVPDMDEIRELFSNGAS